MVEEFDNGGELNNKKSEEQLAKESAFYKDYLREQEEKAEREKRLKREEAKKQQEQANLEAQKAMQEKTEALEKNKSIEESVKNKKVKQRKKRTFATIGLTTIVFGLGAGVGYALLNQPSYEIDCVSNNDDCVFTGEGKYQTGSIVNLGTTDIEGYRFKAWYFNNEMVSEEKDFSFKMDPSKSGTYYVVYEKLYTIDKHSVTNGTVTVDKVNAVKGELVTITATPNDNFFVSSMYYLEEGSATPVVIENNCFLMPEKNVEIVVEFSDVEYLIRTDELSCGTISTDKTKSVVNGRVNVEILLNDGYQIKRAYYRKDGELIKNNLLFDDGYYFEMPESNVSVYVDYELINYTINLDFDGGVGSNPAQLTYNVESETFVIADPVKIGYRFVGWTNTDTSEDYVDTIIETGSFGNLNLKANFEMVNYSIATGSTTHGSISVASSANYGDEVVISTQADLGYGLSELYYVLEGQANHISILNNTFIMPNANITIYAVFEEGSYSISCQKVGQGVVSVNKPSAKQGEEVVVSVAPGVGYALNKFVYVVEGDSTEINIVENTFIMPMANVTIYVEFVIVDYVITKGAESNGAFSVSKTSANYNDEVTITATPSEGYAIDGVYYVVEGSATKYDIENLTFTMPAKNITVYVEFKAIDYTVTTDEIVSGGGVSVSNPTYTIGSQVQIVVTPDPGYDVDDMYYTIDGDDTHYPITDNSFIMPPGDVNIVVDFKLVDYTITKANCNHGSFSVSHQKANYNEQVTLTLLPNAGYQLLKVYYIASGSSDQVLIVNNAFAMPLGDVTVYVEYVAINYEVSKALETNGTFSISKTTAIVNEEVVVTATANVGYEVKRIYYIVSGSSTEVLVSGSSFSMPANNVTVYVEFAAINYDVATDCDSNGGSVSVSDPTPTIGSQVQIVVTPNPGYDVDDMYYTIDGDDTHYPITDNSFIMPPGDVNIVVDFKLVDYTITKANCENGTFTIPQDIANIGNVITITTQPNAGYELDRIYYIESGSTTENVVSGTSFVMPASNITVYVEFAAITYSVVGGTSSGGTIIISGPTSTVGTQIVVDVTPNPGYDVDDMYYTIDGDDTQYPIIDNTFVMPPGDVSVFVDFKLIDYTITKATCENGSFTVSDDVANLNAHVTVQVSPNDGYELKSMYYIKEGTENKVNIINNFFLMPSSNITVYVEYKLIDYNVSIGSFSNGTITLLKSTANFNEEVQIEVTPNDGYLLGEVYYVLDGTGFGEDIVDNKFTMPKGNVTLYAEFIAIDYTVATGVATNGTLGVSKTTANVGDIINVVATPNRGYSLKRVYYVIAGDVTEHVISASITMPANNINVYVEFEVVNYTITKAEMKNGSVDISKTTAVYGENVTISVTPNTDYELDEIYYVIDSSQQKVVITGSEFVMPDENITVYATFKELILLTMNVDGDSTAYKVTRGDVLSSVVPNIDPTNAKTNNEYTCGLYLDEGLTQEADLTKQITTSITLYTKKATLSSLSFTSQNSSSSYYTTISSSATEVVIPLEYNKKPVTLVKAGVKVTDIVLSKNITSIDSGALVFADLANISVCGGNQTFVVDNNCLINMADKKLIRGTINSVIPTDGSVTIIGSYAFSARNITSIIIPDGVTEIENYAFRNCVKLVDLQIANSVKKIGSHAFFTCSALTNLILPSGLETIGGSAFAYCTKITSVEIPESCKTIQYDAFRFCSKLNEVIFNEGLQTIGQKAFESAALLSVALPSTVTSIGTNPFGCNERLESITMQPNIGDYYTVDNCLIYRPTKSLISGCKKSIIPGGGEVLILANSSFYNGVMGGTPTIPEGVTTLEENSINTNGRGAMYTSSISLPSTITRIAPGALKPFASISIIENSVYYSKDNCIIKKSNKELVYMGNDGVIPGGGEVLIIGEHAFDKMGYYRELVIPEGVTTINNYAFEDDCHKKIILPSTITSYAPNAMYRAWEVEEVVIKSSAVYNSFVWNADSYDNEKLTKITVLSSADDGSNTSYISNTSKFRYQYKNAVLDNEVINVYYVTNPSNLHVATITFDVSGTTQSYSILMEGSVPNIDSIIPTEILNQATDGFYLDPDYQTKVDISLNWVKYMNSLTGELKLYVK